MFSYACILINITGYIDANRSFNSDLYKHITRSDQQLFALLCAITRVCVFKLTLISCLNVSVNMVKRLNFFSSSRFLRPHAFRPSPK